MRLEDSENVAAYEDSVASSAVPASSRVGHAPLGTRAFVAILAGLMGINALAVDIILPAFSDIASELRTDATSVQLLITSYMLGFGLSQIFVGFAADRFGRKPVLILGLLIYGATAAASAFSTSLTMILVFRFLQGIGAGAPRVIAAAAARDCYEGRDLARVMSLVMTIFMSVPIFAPLIGQGIWVVSGWREIFIALVIYALLMIWICWRHLPETLLPERRRPIRLVFIAEAFRSIFGNRQTVGYSIAAGIFFGALIGFIITSQQLLVGVYGLGLWFPVVFACMAIASSAASFMNSMLVHRYGMRILSHAAVVATALISATLFFLSWFGHLPAPAFLFLQSLNLFLIGLVFPNFNALAMEPQGRIAGVAASFVSATSVVLGALIAYFIGKGFDGTATPLTFGFLLCALGTLIVLAIVEKGRLFRPVHSP